MLLRMEAPTEITFLGNVDFRKRSSPIRHKARRPISPYLHHRQEQARARSTLLGTHGHTGFCTPAEALPLSTPHGDLVAGLHAEAVRNNVPNVVYLDATDPSQPYGYNPLRQRPRLKHSARGRPGCLKSSRRCGATRGACEWEHILRNALYALPRAAQRPRFRIFLDCFRDRTFRKTVASSLKKRCSSRVSGRKEFERYSFGYPRADGVASIQNKIGGVFLADPVMPAYF